MYLIKLINLNLINLIKLEAEAVNGLGLARLCLWTVRFGCRGVENSKVVPLREKIFITIFLMNLIEVKLKLLAGFAWQV